MEVVKGGCFGSPWAKPQLREIVLTVNQQPNNMISVAYGNITVRYSLKTGRENRKLSQFFLSLSFFYTLNMYCMKALGVVHFKGNWTNKKKTLCTLPSSCLSRFRKLPPPPDPHSINNADQFVDCAAKRRGWTFGCVCFSECVCVWRWMCNVRGFACLADLLLVLPINVLGWWLRWDHMAQDRTKELLHTKNKTDWQYLCYCVAGQWTDFKTAHACLKDLNSWGHWDRKMLSSMCLCCRVFSTILLKESKRMKWVRRLENPDA